MTTEEQLADLKERIERLAGRLEAEAMNCIEGAECAETKEASEKSFARSVGYERAAANLRNFLKETNQEKADQ